MGNACKGEDRPELELNPEYTAAEHELLRTHAKDKPNSNYAEMRGKISRLPIIDQVLGEHTSKRALQRPERRGNMLPMHYIKKRDLFYEGQWVGGRPNGVGKIYQKDGTYLEGPFINGQIEGTDGIVIHPDGSYYRGSFSNSQLHGHGQFYYRYNGLRYIGEWLNGKPHGRGVQTYRDGSRYQGQFLNGLKHDDHGVFMWPDGRRYEGQFRDGYMDGHGILVNTRGKGRFQGIFRRNLKVEGKLRTEFGTYEGGFHNGEMHGPGKFYWDDGKLYEGGFYNGNLHGDGHIIYPTGQVARGNWVHGENIRIEDINTNRN